MMEGQATYLPEPSQSPKSTSCSTGNAFAFTLGDLSDGDGVFAAGSDGSLDHHDHCEEDLAANETQWASFTSDFSLLFNTSSASDPNYIFGQPSMESLANYSSGNSDLSRSSHGSSAPRPRLSNDATLLGVQGVLMTTQIINVVEAALANKFQSLEVVLGTIHKAGVALNGLIGLLHQHGTNQHCFMLFAVVLYQVADLMEAGIESLDTLNCQRVAGSSGSAASHSILDRLDSLNDLISSYQSVAAASALHWDDDKVHRWTRRLKEELDASLMTVGRLMGLDRAGPHSYGHEEHGKQRVGGCVHLEALADRFHLLRRRLSK